MQRLCGYADHADLVRRINSDRNWSLGGDSNLQGVSVACVVIQHFSDAAVKSSGHKVERNDGMTDGHGMVVFLSNYWKCNFPMSTCAL